MRYCLMFLLPVLAAASSGCNLLTWPLYVFAPPVPTKSVDAEFDGLRRKTVAVVIYAGADTLFEYPAAPLEVSEAVAAKMRENIDKVTVVDSRRVILYQDENPRWDAMPPERLCQVFNADYVLLIALLEFTTREPGLGHLARGRITAEATLYRPPQAVSPGQGGKPVWQAAGIRVVFPEESPLGVPAGDDWPIRVQTERIFADLLVKKFYKHKAPVEP